MKLTADSFISKRRAKLERRQVLCGFVRNISCSTSPGLTLDVCGEVYSLHSPKMLQYSNMPDFFFLNLCLISLLLTLSGAEPAPRPLGNELL